MLQRLRRLLEPPAVEKRTVELAGTAVTYTLKRTRRRRSIGLRIDDDGLTVNVPQRASEKWLLSVLQDKADWVLEKLGSWQTRKPQLPQWRDGETILFRGDSLTLRIVPSLFETSLQLFGARLFMHIQDIQDAVAIEQGVQAWYQTEALRLFEECVAHYAPLMGVSPRAVKLSSARTQWGSCTTRGVVRLNWQLIRMPLPLIDYVVVHELAHLLEMNHSAAFWRVVGKACPDYARLRRELHKWSPAAG